MTGFGRTGRWFGLDHWAVTADIVVAAKGRHRAIGRSASRGVRHDP